MPKTNSAKPTLLRSNALESVLMTNVLDLEKAFAERKKHVPGQNAKFPTIPSGLTIERLIDTPVCNVCKNPGRRKMNYRDFFL